MKRIDLQQFCSTPEQETRDYCLQPISANGTAYGISGPRAVRLNSASLAETQPQLEATQKVASKLRDFFAGCELHDYITIDPSEAEALRTTKLDYSSLSNPKQNDEVFFNPELLRPFLQLEGLQVYAQTTQQRLLLKFTGGYGILMGLAWKPETAQ